MWGEKGEQLPPAESSGGCWGGGRQAKTPSCQACKGGPLCPQSNQSILKEINPKYLLEGLMLKLKLHYFGHMM